MQAQIRGADVAQPRAPAWLLGSQLRLGQGKCFLSPFVREELRKDCLGEPRRAFGLELSWHHPCLHHLYLYKQFILLGCNCHQSELASDKIQHRLLLRASSASSKSPPVYIKKKKKCKQVKNEHCCKELRQNSLPNRGAREYLSSPHHTKVQQKKRRAAVAQVMLLHAAILWSSGRHQAGSQGELIVGIGPVQ